MTSNPQRGPGCIIVGYGALRFLSAKRFGTRWMLGVADPDPVRLGREGCSFQFGRASTRLPPAFCCASSRAKCRKVKLARGQQTLVVEDLRERGRFSIHLGGQVRILHCAR